MIPMKILILGASGMLGNAILRKFAMVDELDVFGTVRTERSRQLLPAWVRKHVATGVDVNDIDSLTLLLGDLRPDVVINCVGLVKQLSQCKDPIISIPINTLFPHRLARLCALGKTRLIHMSTDCVFDGLRGDYTEDDVANAQDLYGQSKYWGEVDYSNAITLRTSIIGHELDGARSLIDWFLSQESEVRGFSRVIYSGLPTVEIATVILKYVLPNPSLRGVYNLSANSIDKYSLLKLVAQVYQKNVALCSVDQPVIDRSLNSTRFQRATGYRPRPWPELIESMRAFG